MNKNELVNNKKNEMFAAMSVMMICETFENTNTNNDENIHIVRGWLMDELEKRNPETFESWMSSDDINKIDYPSRFYFS